MQHEPAPNPRAPGRRGAPGVVSACAAGYSPSAAVASPRAALLPPCTRTLLILDLAPAHPLLALQVVAQCSKCQRVFQQQSVPSKCDEDDCPAFNLRARPNTPSA